ncbi:hypothetical protein [Horticoccus sp. 23ND18S-11]|uniref:hypothetical protein n=1 Tax=Horticoccus sp. 23ND18S-11 TaxID=3391832 RepID=UPI0039C9A51E
MKYVALQPAAGGTIEYRLGLLTTHADMAAPLLERGYRVVSAGFVRCLGGDRFETFGYSTSLNATPHADDARVISALHMAVLKMAPVPI